jgi:hypothetical protein
MGYGSLSAIIKFLFGMGVFPAINVLLEPQIESVGGMMMGAGGMCAQLWPILFLTLESTLFVAVWVFSWSAATSQLEGSYVN